MSEEARLTIWLLIILFGICLFLGFGFDTPSSRAWFFGMAAVIGMRALWLMIQLTVSR